MPRETDEYKASDCEKGLEKTFMDMMEKQGAKFVDVSDPYTCQVCGKKLKPAKECVNYSTNKWDGHSYKCPCWKTNLILSIG